MISQALKVSIFGVYVGDIWNFENAYLFQIAAVESEND
jgi:hypothetical protein